MFRFPVVCQLFAVLLSVPLQAQQRSLEDALADTPVQQGLTRIEESAGQSALTRWREQAQAFNDAAGSER